jgi:hypothetical protein
MRHKGEGDPVRVKPVKDDGVFLTSCSCSCSVSADCGIAYRTTKSHLQYHPIQLQKSSQSDFRICRAELKGTPVLVNSDTVRSLPNTGLISAQRAGLKDGETIP